MRFEDLLSSEIYRPTPRVIRKRRRPSLDDNEIIIKEEKVKPHKEEKEVAPPKESTITISKGRLALMRKYLDDARYGEMLMRSNMEKLTREVRLLEKELE